MNNSCSFKADFQEVVPGMILSFESLEAKLFMLLEGFFFVCIIKVLHCIIRTGYIA